MPWLCARALSYWHADGVPLFDSLNLSLDAFRTGIVGANGAGKTTLLEILAGRRPPSAGTVTATARRELLSQHEEGRRNPEVSVADWLGVAGVLEALRTLDLERIGDDWNAPDRARAALDAIGLSSIALDRPASTLSGGEQTRVRLAGCLLKEPDVLLLDEPTNHLDREGREALLAWWRTWPGRILVASHDRELLGHCDEIWELGPRGLRGYGGDYARYVDEKTRETAAAQRGAANARAELDRARAAQSAAVEKQKKRAERGRKQSERSNEPKIFRGWQKERAQNTLARKSGVHEDRVARARSTWDDARAEVHERPALRLDFEPPDSKSKSLVEARGLVLRLPDGTPLWKEPLSFSLRAGDRMALTGANGSGKTSLLRAILSSQTEGLEVRTRRVGYLDQSLATLDDQATLLENLLRAEPRLGETTARIRLGRLGFAQEQALKLAASLSGGERVRLSLGCLFAPAPELLLLDEPSNHLDLESLATVEEALREYPGAILVASHDRAFLEALGVTSELTLRSPPRLC